MPECPKCKANIDTLDYYAEDEDSGYYDGDYTSRYTSTLSIEFKCPECREIIAKTEVEAERILCGKP